MTATGKTRCIGILTSGGDCPGLNAAIRGVAKAAMGRYGMKVVGIYDGFRGLVENRTVLIDARAVSGILTYGGTILGTSRDKPHKMPMGGKTRNMTAVAVENARRLQLDCLVCLGGGGTQKNALRLHEEGDLNVMTLPKTIDNDVAMTDITFGFDTALQIAANAIDRLHTTATSHHRIIVCEVMGHRAGWLALGAGIAGGADVILIPEIPYDPEVVAEHIIDRRRAGSRFSIVAVAEGIHSKAEAKAAGKAPAKGKKKSRTTGKGGRSASGTSTARRRTSEDDSVPEPVASRVARELQRLTGIDARVTSLGHVQRGGTPTATDRLLCTRLGTAAARLLDAGTYNVMVASRGGACEPVPLAEVAGRTKLIPLDHHWIDAALMVDTCLGDRL